MVGPLRDSPLPARRRLAWFLLVLAVLAAHGWITAELADRLEAAARAAAMPERIQAVYVRELQPAAPPVVAPAPPPPPVPRPRRAAVPKPAASAPRAVAETSAPAASEPEPPPLLAVVEPPVAEPAPSMPEPAASEPVPVAPEAASAPPPAASAPPPFEWPGATRLSYKLTGHVRGEVHGDAQVEWVRQGTRYQVHVDVTVGLPIAPLLTRRSSSEGELTDAGLVPRRYDEDTKQVFRDRRRLTLHFEPDAVLMPDGRRRERWPGTQDAASQFVQLSWLFTTRPELLREGGSIEFPLALPRNVDRWTYDVLGEEPVTTLFGQVNAFHLKPRRLTRPGGELVAEIWFAPTLRYLPARIRIQQDPETFIDLVLARKPELGAP